MAEKGLSNMSKKNESQTFIDRVVGFSLASWVNCIITVIATPITTALFSPEEMGKIALFLSYSNIIIPFIYLGFDQAYCRFYHEPVGNNTKESLFRLTSHIILALTVLASVVVICLWRYFSNRIIGYPTILIAINLIIYSFGLVFSRLCAMKCRMDNNVKQFCIQSIIATIIVKLSFVLVVIISPTAELAITVRSIFLFLVFLLFFTIAYNKTKSTIDCKKETLIKLSKYSLPLFPTVFLVTFNSSLSQIMLKEYVDFRLLGIYNNGLSIAGLISVIQSGLGSFWTPFVYEYYKKDQTLIQKVQSVITVVVIVLALLIMVSQDLVYLILVDKAYWESKAILALLLVTPVCNSLSETLGQGVELSGKTILKLPAYAINLLVNYLSCIIFIPMLGILGAAIASALASLSMLVTRAAIGERFYKCCSNYFKMILALLILVAAGFLNYYLHSFVYYFLIIALLAVMIMYHKEIKMIISRGSEYLINLKKRKVK